MNGYRSGRCGSAARRRLRRALFASAGSFLIVALETPIHADSISAATDGAAAADQPADQQYQDIVVTGQALFKDVRPERSLDEEAVASYGVSTIDELINELQSELADDEEPVFMVNGERVYDLDDIGAYPVEIVKQVQVLPRGTAAQVGGSPNQRVFRLTLQNRMRSGTVTIAPRFATEGDWGALRAEAIGTMVAGKERGNVALRVRDEDNLRESQRGIIQPATQIRFGPRGNVIAYPDLSGEIDPLLSAAAGEVVTVVPLPSEPNPTLADFVPGANEADLEDLGNFRTLRPNLRSYDFNASYTTPLAPWLTSTATLRLGRSTNRSLIGVQSGLFLLEDTNPFSPFSVPVAIAVSGNEPLTNRFRRDSGEGNVTLTARLGGDWRLVFNGKYHEATDRTRTLRSNSSTATPLDDSTNPFSVDFAGLIDVTTQRARSHYRTANAGLTLTGTPIRLPAGDLTTTVEARLGWQSINSESGFTDQKRKLHRSEQSGRAVIDVPLASRRNGFLSQLGEVGLNAGYSAIHFSDASDAHRSILGLTWEPIEALRLRGSLESVKEPPAIEILGAPTIVTPFVRIFDPLTGETVEVTYVSGGNPGLRSQKTDTGRLSAILRLVPSLGLQLNAEYTDIRNRNFVSGLPAASQAVMLAFPERFVRDANGVLTLVDVRPVNFANHRQQRLRWGLNLNAPLGGGAKPSFAAADSDESVEESAAAATAAAARRPPTRLQFNANHTIVFEDKILIRPGLAPVDLLDGGATGIAGGRVRHQLDATLAVTSGGTGVRLGATWLGSSNLETRIDGVEQRLRFSPLFVLNLRAFADAKHLFPSSGFASGMRLSLNLINLTNERQRVRDRFGNTPLQYQPAYRDPIGRTIEFEIRKVF